MGKKVISRINKIIAGRYEGEYKEKYQEYLPKGLIGLHEEYIAKTFPAKSN